jgi:preprotein translocase subunit SecF
MKAEPSAFRDIIPVGTKIDFIGSRLYWIGFSAVLVLMSLLLAAFKGIPLGIDFQGGTLVEVRFQGEKPSPSNMRKALAGLVGEDLLIQPLGQGAMSGFLLRTGPREDLEGFSQRLHETLYRAFGKDAQVARVEMVGPAMSQGLRRKGYIAVLLTWVAMLVYIALRFEFAYGLGAVLALIHDTSVCLGAMALTSREFSLVTLAALLTIIGYSVNDTIVVCDRIRENTTKMGKKISLPELINISINETLSRTVVTSLTVLLVLLSLFIFGNSLLRDFAFVMLVGVVIGTYSSIFIAAPIVLFFKKPSGA